ncbi:phosphotransferase [Rhodococcus koreensis]
MSDLGTVNTRSSGAALPTVTFADEVDSDSRTEVLDLLTEWDSALFPGDRVEVSLLSGGANNRNFIVRSGDAKYALRVANSLNDRMAVDRASAFRAQQDAAAVGVAPEVKARKSPAGHMLSQFVAGTALSVDTIHNSAALAAIASAFHRLHIAPARCRNFEPFRDIEMWIGFARADNVDVPPTIDQLLERASHVERVFAGLNLPRVFCHNDTVPQNFLLNGGSVCLVDWDYAGMGYAAFELGSFSCTADLEPTETAEFLRAYDPNLDAPALARVRLMQFVAGLREIAWVLSSAAILRGTTMVPDSFYDEYLVNNLRRAVNFGLGQDFPQLLATASERGTSTLV